MLLKQSTHDNGSVEYETDLYIFIFTTNWGNTLFIYLDFIRLVALVISIYFSGNSYTAFEKKKFSFECLFAVVMRKFV